MNIRKLKSSLLSYVMIWGITSLDLFHGEGLAMIQTSNDKNYDPDYSKISDMADKSKKTHNIFAHKFVQDNIVNDYLNP